MSQPPCDIGMIGLGVMGRNLALNMADHGYTVAGYDTLAEKVRAFAGQGDGGRLTGAATVVEFVNLLRKPRAAMFLVPAGSPVDAVIDAVTPHLEPGDVLIDGGNSHFHDTDRRASALAAKGLAYLGIGISGGEEGARHGPSIMPGGPAEAYQRVRPIVEAVAAQVEGRPCAAWLGPGSAGHYVKMVHNGIEYGLMRLIAETYDLMKRGLGLDNDQLAATYEAWNARGLDAYLLEITAHIFRQVDSQTGGRLIDVILDEARQKGTGMWTSQDAMALQVPVPTIDVAVLMRDLSVFRSERAAASHLLGRQTPPFRGERETFLDQLRDALHASILLTFAQGMALLGRASAAYGYQLPLGEVARIWRGGCIIRTALLRDIRAAYEARPDLPNLLLDPGIAGSILNLEDQLRAVVVAAAELGLAVPGLMASLAYLDSYRSAWSPSNLIEAQRDYFGAHTYERIDRPGTFHTQWTEGARG